MSFPSINYDASPFQLVVAAVMCTVLTWATFHAFFWDSTRNGRVFPKRHKTMSLPILTFVMMAYGIALAVFVNIYLTQSIAATALVFLAYGPWSFYLGVTKRRVLFQITHWVLIGILVSAAIYISYLR